METYPQLIPLLILVPALGTFINFFWGGKLGEKYAGYIAVSASVFTFIISVLIFAYLTSTHGLGTVVDPFAVFDGWIRIGASEFAVDIPWQFRVDTLTAVMLMVVTGVGSLIHIYSVGYIHGDPKATRFFAYLNMFLAFMLILVTGNNFLMMFVGWEGVGLCSFLLIGYWWDKKGETGWDNANAGRKAMLANRIGDFGILMAAFMIFWTFGTLNYYSAGEVANVEFQLHAQGLDHADEADHSAEADDADEEGDHDAGSASTETDDHSAEEGYGHGAALTAEDIDNSQFMPYQLGVFNQVKLLTELEEGEEIPWFDTDGDGVADVTRGRDVDMGPFSLDISIVLNLIVLFLLLGAAGKSAQIPLFVWLPDAMAGPTPVSALMHAATMVTAGIYLLVRSSVFLDHAPQAAFVIALIGTGTALVGGFTALGQWDIKRVLAYSTVSQLGFMIAAVGIGAYVAAMFHLVTHAFFKALLFLGSGSVIHGVEHGEHHVHDHGHHDEHDEEHHAGEAHHDEHAFDAQDMRNMGGLASRMPVTFVTYLLGTLALAGLPIFAGFWSKDEILADAFHKMIDGHDTLNIIASYIVFGGLLIAAGFTAFYMWRQIQMVFFGEPRSEAAAHAPESVPSMTWPLVILAFFSIFAGFFNVPEGSFFDYFYKLHEFGHWLEASIPAVTEEGFITFNWLVAIVATALAGGAIYLAHSIYAGDKAVINRTEEHLGDDPLTEIAQAKRAWIISNARLYWDDIYDRVFVKPYQRIGKFFAETLDWKFLHDYFHDRVIKRGFDTTGDLLKDPIDIGLIDGVVNGVGRLVTFVSGRMRGIQNGYVRTYAVVLLLGVVVVIVAMFWPLLMNGS